MCIVLCVIREACSLYDNTRMSYQYHLLLIFSYRCCHLPHTCVSTSNVTYVTMTLCQLNNVVVFIIDKRSTQWRCPTDAYKEKSDHYIMVGRRSAEAVSLANDLHSAQRWAETRYTVSLNHLTQYTMSQPLDTVGGVARCLGATLTHWGIVYIGWRTWHLCAGVEPDLRLLPVALCDSTTTNEWSKWPNSPDADLL